MKTKLALTILMLSASLAMAQEKMADSLRKAIVEEESNQNLDKAIQAYQSILKQFDEERKTAATALFHLADCYRKQGKSSEAIAAYKRVAQEFGDQTQLAEASRNYLSKTYGLNQAQLAAGSNPETIAARRQYRLLLEQEIQLMETRIVDLEKQVQAGTIWPSSSEMITARRELLELRRNLVAFDAGAPIPPITIR
jgi:tetratricopeptide (TPR) repeat protein